ncbi:biotin transporter BioY [Mesorhizobium sp. 2RAF21]|uniref:biotin transporter BioY n=1 Tax=Mesorhizobium sp. 2RAF21 TaxID=3232995 RepID=UPI003F9E31DB
MPCAAGIEARSPPWPGPLLAGAIIYVPGLLWLGSVIGFDKPVLQYGFIPFIPGDIIKALLAALVFPVAGKWLYARSGR